jgi:hypothetical protein
MAVPRRGHRDSGAPNKRSSARERAGVTRCMPSIAAGGASGGCGVAIKRAAAASRRASLLAVAWPGRPCPTDDGVVSRERAARPVRPRRPAGGQRGSRARILVVPNGCDSNRIRRKLEFNSSCVRRKRSPTSPHVCHTDLAKDGARKGRCTVIAGTCQPSRRPHGGTISRTRSKQSSGQ